VKKVKSVKKPKKRGVKPMFGSKLKSVLVGLDPESIKRAHQFGAGNLSAGIRYALKECK
jgi:hypothetical protein